MPIPVSIHEVKLERADLYRRVQLPRTVGADGYVVPPARTPGLHLSGLLKYIADTSRIGAYRDQIAEEEYPLRWLMGQAWEEFAASLYPAMEWQPGEVSEPVLMTPDGLSYGASGVLIEEFKHRRAKALTGADFIKKQWLYLQQGMGYCLGYGVDTVRWHTLNTFEFPDPRYVQYVIRFTDEDLRGMERMIEANRQAAIEAGYAES